MRAVDLSAGTTFVQRLHPACPASNPDQASPPNEPEWFDLIFIADIPVLRWKAGSRKQQETHSPERVMCSAIAAAQHMTPVCRCTRQAG
ncbi:hypothetical protein PSAC2689_140046 [Paraburkholderia sacchari]